MSFEFEVVHDSMSPTTENQYGLKPGQKVKSRNQKTIRTIKSITKAGEVFYVGGGWDYDYEVFCWAGLCKCPTDEFIEDCSMYISSDECPFKTGKLG